MKNKLEEALGALFTLEPSFNSRKRDAKEQKDLAKEVENIFKNLEKEKGKR